jgi:transporter family-2 protein
MYIIVRNGKRRNQLSNLQLSSLFGLGVIAGAMIAIQSVLNATLGVRLGHLGSVLILTVVSILFLLLAIFLFPSTATLKSMPGLDEWHLYIGGVLGVVILVSPIILLPRLGTTSTLVAIVSGQLVMALFIDHFGLLASPKIVATLPRILGIALVALGAFLVAR